MPNPDDKEAVKNCLLQHQPQYVLVLITESLPLCMAIAETCLLLNIPYIDTSEDPSHINAIEILNMAAQSQNVVILTGVNKLPCLSSVVIDNYAKQFSTLREIFCGLACAPVSNRYQ